MDAEDQIVNKVSNSALISFDLEEYYQPGERVVVDITDQLYEGIILKEKDFRDFINALNINNVRYILVGGYSVILHGHPRTTGDMDIWVDRTSENYKRISSAFLFFGMPVFDMTEYRFLNDFNIE